MISVTDTTLNLTATEAFPLSINPLITLTPSVSSTGTEDTTYQSGTIAAAGSPNGPYTFSAANLPPGLSLVPVNTPTTTAQVQGTPTQWGTYTFTVTATDADQNTGSQTYEVTIEPDMSFALTTDPSQPVLTAGEHLLDDFGRHDHAIPE